MLVYHLAGVAQQHNKLVKRLDLPVTDTVDQKIDTGTRSLRNASDTGLEDFHALTFSLLAAHKKIICWSLATYCYSKQSRDILACRQQFSRPNASE